jgi:hypothetical protein
VTIGGSGTASGVPETFTNYQVHVWLRRHVPAPIELALDRAVDRLVTEMDARPRPIRKPRPRPKGIMVELALYDLHLGKLAWHRETGEDYDVRIASAVHHNAVDDIMNRISGWRVDSFLVPIGNDFFHADNDDAQTPRGKNHLDVEGRLPKSFEEGISSMTSTVDACLNVAPVKMVWIPGNHDPRTSYYLFKLLEARYEHDRHVSVDVSLSPRKYHRHGTCLLGLTHGSEESHKDLPLIMAGEVPEDWARTTCRELHVGHFHKRKQTVHVAGESIGPVMVRILPSLSAADAWHHSRGYVNGPRAAEAYLWSAKSGYVGHFSVDARR